MGQRQGYCAKCGRTGLTADDFPKSAIGHIYDTCILCETARSKRDYVKHVATVPGFLEEEAARLRQYRQRKRRDPKYLEKERLRVAASRERTKHAHAA